MAKPGTVTGWKLPHAERELLLGRFPPRYENVVADHVTLCRGSMSSSPLPECPRSSNVVGRADDGDSLECLVIEIDETTDRPDGSTYHITWSLGPGRHPRQSNNLIRDRGWDHIEKPIPVELIPARF